MNTDLLLGKGYTDRFLSESEVRDVLADTFKSWELTGQKVLVIIPDGTRTAPVGLFFRLIHEFLSGKAKKLDFLIALGTHQPMGEEAVNKLLSTTTEELRTRYKDVAVFNHHWENPENFVTLGTITAEETLEFSRGMLKLEVPVRINRLVLDYDVLLICGPVFPHEVVGYSGGNKYFFPGIAGGEVINFTHWLAALITNYEVIGTKYTPVREVINKAASFINRKKLAICMVAQHDGLSGVFTGTPEAAWSAAADISAQVHVRYLDKPVKQVLSVMPDLYDDIWTGAKGMYKMEPVVSEGGEVIIYAPHISEISYTHGKILDEIGYHVRDYFVKQWDQFKHYPWGVLAHSTHVRGLGTFENGIERPRIQVTLATGVSKERTEKVCLNYRDPKTIRPVEWQGRETEGILMVPRAGEYLYRLKK
ncbi:MAG TPA: lactate racemase domain-containing protein [Anaerolineaceae bacterium]